METLAAELESEGYPVQFVLVSDQNADYFINIDEPSTVPLFRDAEAGRPAWKEMNADSRKHDTFVYTRAGDQALFWDASKNSLGAWSADIRTAVEAQGL